QRIARRRAAHRLDQHLRELRLQLARRLLDIPARRGLRGSESDGVGGWEEHQKAGNRESGTGNRKSGAVEVSEIRARAVGVLSLRCMREPVQAACLRWPVTATGTGALPIPGSRVPGPGFI